ncbi:MAG: TIGR00341 family protein [Halodesulfurarchaeum sp.]
MRLVQVTVPTGKRQAVVRAFEQLELEYAVTEEIEQRNVAAVISAPVPTEGVEDVLDRLREAGLEADSFTVVLDAQTVVSRRFEALQDRYEEAGEEDSATIAREELVSTVEDLAPRFSIYLVLSAISAVVATAGILLDSPAVVVGSMVIAPLIGPAMATSVGSVVADNELFVQGVSRQAVGFAVSILAAAVFALFARWINLVPPGIDLMAIDQVTGRLSPDFLSLAVALGAGVAGALSLSTGVSTALVGVMIAAALVPPTAVVGIGIAWMMPQAVLGASVLVLVNVLSINLAALVVLWHGGYQPENWLLLSEARSATIERVAALLVAIALLSVFLGGTTLSMYGTATFEEDARSTIEATVEGTDASLLAVEYRSERTLLYREVDEIVVTVGTVESNPPSGLAGELRERVRERTDRDVPVEVRYTVIERA